MSISFCCSKCETSFHVSDEHAGKRAKCKKCGAPLRIPSLAGQAKIPPLPPPDAHPQGASGAVKADVCASATPPHAYFIRPVGALVLFPFILFGHMWGPQLGGMTLPYMLAVGGTILVGLVFLFALCPRTVNWSTAIRVGAFTATVGIVLCLLLQEVVGWIHSHPEWLDRGGGPIKLLHLLLFLVGGAYASAKDLHADLVARLFGFTVGVGMCEEACKILPILWLCRSEAKNMPTLRECMFLGAFSGLGFGIPEALHYSHSEYLPDGVQVSLYLLRFTALPALHALWTATVAGIVRSRVNWLNAGKGSWGAYGAKVALLSAGPAFLHGVYNVFSGKLLDLVVVTASLGVAYVVFRSVIVDDTPPSRNEQRTIFEKHLRDKGTKKALGTIALVALVGSLVFYSGSVSPAQPQQDAPQPQYIITVPQRQPVQCMACSGTGQVVAECPSCGGTGRDVVWGVRCPTCRGFGVGRTPCPYCGGTGWR